MAAVPRVQKKARDAPSWEPLDTAARDRAPVLCMGYTLSMTESSLLCFKELPHPADEEVSQPSSHSAEAAQEGQAGSEQGQRGLV